MGIMVSVYWTCPHANKPHIDSSHINSRDQALPTGNVILVKYININVNITKSRVYDPRLDKINQVGIFKRGPWENDYTRWCTFQSELLPYFDHFLSFVMHFCSCSVNHIHPINLSICMYEANMKRQNANIALVLIFLGCAAHICCALRGWEPCAIVQARNLEETLH